MSYIRCNACLHREACDETVPEGSDKPGMCWNAHMNLRAYEAQRAALRANGGSAAPQPVASPPARPAKAPPSPSRPPGAGSVTEQIFAACEAQLAELRGSGATSGDLFKEARRRAIPQLEAAGVNSNSARKGSSMWLATKG